MLAVRECNAEPIPGYRLIEPLGRGGFGEVWKCLAPGGLYKAIKFVAGDPTGLGAERTPASQELQAIQYIKSIRHPFLLSMERVEVLDGGLVIVMELADNNLLDLLHERRCSGNKGLDRAELLGYLGEAANVLDYMNLRHGLQHLDIKPANLFVIADHVKVADFGLVRSLADWNGAESLGAITPLYAAPELFKNRLSSSCDQYSLAVVYVELLTGQLPFDGKNSRQLMLQHSTALPNLEGLSPGDQVIIARALAKDPDERFASCTELVNALLDEGSGAGPLPPVAPTSSLSKAETRQVRRSQVETQTELPIVSGTLPVQPPLGKYLPEMQFCSCLGRTASAESWEAQSADGRRWLVRFLSGVTGHDPAREQEALARLQALQHDLLLPVELMPAGPGCLITVQKLLESSLRSRFQEARQDGSAGLPRRQLLDWLWPLAEALDELAQQKGLAHLGLHPGTLHFQDERLQIADFGLIPLLWQPASLHQMRISRKFMGPAELPLGQPAGLLQGQLSPGYTAPEVLEMRGSRQSDQYSLAVIFQEMLTGELPWTGLRRGDPDLSRLPAADQPVLARALQVDPGKRFASCRALLEALDQDDSGPVVAPPGAESLSPARTILAELLAEADGRAAWVTGPGGESILQYRFSCPAGSSGTQRGLEAFRRQWRVQLVRTGKETLRFRVRGPATLWQRLMRRTPGIQVEVQWAPARPPTVPLPEILVQIRGRKKGCLGDLALARQIGPRLLESLRGHLLGHPERRTQERRLWTQPVQAAFVLPDGQFSHPIECFGKDVSLNGMGLYLPCAALSSEIEVTFTTPSRPEPITLAGKCVRVQHCGEDWYELGVQIS